MKNRPFSKRLGYALNGWRLAFQSESSFRTQVGMGSLAVIVLAALQASAVWWAIFLLMIATILALELVNTAFEALADKLHPESDSQIGRAKDCLAGSVLLLSVTSVALFGIFLLSRF